MQEYNRIEDTEYISDAPAQLNKNFESIISDFSGASFPTVNLISGMTCYRTDLNAVYRYNGSSWKLEYEITNDGIKVKNAESLANSKTETWTFTLADGSTVNKKVVLL